MLQCHCVALSVTDKKQSLLPESAGQFPGIYPSNECFNLNLHDEEYYAANNAGLKEFMCDRLVWKPHCGSRCLEMIYFGKKVDNFEFNDETYVFEMFMNSIVGKWCAGGEAPGRNSTR